MDILKIDLQDRRQVQEFLDLPFKIYQDIPEWVPALQKDERTRLDPKRYPYYKHSDASFFLVRQNACTLGRLAVLDSFLYNENNNEQAAFFYMFECENNQEAASELFAAGSEWARSRGLNKMIGPKGFTALDGLGLLVKGFDLRPAFGLPYNPPYYPKLIESLKFEPTSEIASGYLDPGFQFPQRIHDLAERLKERRGLWIARYRTRTELRNALKYLEELYNGVLEGTVGGTPITKGEIKALARQMLWFADPNLIKIVMKGKVPIGFLLAYPDISGAFQKTKGRLFPFGWLTIIREMRKTDRININGAGMIEEYRGLGGTAILYSEMFKSVIENPRYHHAEIVQIGMENEKMLREMGNFGVEFNKVHRIYQKKL
jgi:hypothetical protein